MATGLSRVFHVAAWAKDKVPMQRNTVNPIRRIIEAISIRRSCLPKGKSEDRVIRGNGDILLTIHQIGNRGR